MDISVNITYKPFKSETCILEIQMEGRMSQSFDDWPSLYLRNVEIYEEKLPIKLPVK